MLIYTLQNINPFLQESFALKESFAPRWVQDSDERMLASILYQIPLSDNGSIAFCKGDWDSSSFEAVNHGTASICQANLLKIALFCFVGRGIDGKDRR